MWCSILIVNVTGSRLTEETHHWACFQEVARFGWLRWGASLSYRWCHFMDWGQRLSNWENELGTGIHLSASWLHAVWPSLLQLLPHAFATTMDCAPLKLWAQTDPPPLSCFLLGFVTAVRKATECLQSWNSPETMFSAPLDPPVV